MRQPRCQGLHKCQQSTYLLIDKNTKILYPNGIWIYIYTLFLPNPSVRQHYQDSKCVLLRSANDVKIKHWSLLFTVTCDNTASLDYNSKYYRLAAGTSLWLIWAGLLSLLWALFQVAYPHAVLLILSKIQPTIVKSCPLVILILNNILESIFSWPLKRLLIVPLNLRISGVVRPHSFNASSCLRSLSPGTSLLALLCIAQAYLCHSYDTASVPVYYIILSSHHNRSLDLSHCWNVSPSQCNCYLCLEKTNVLLILFQAIVK